MNDGYIQGCQGLEWCRLGYPSWELWIKYIPGRYLFPKNAWKTKNMSTSSWIQRGPARACGESEMGPKSFLAGESSVSHCKWFSFNASTGTFARFARRFDQESDLHTIRFQLNRWKTHHEGKKSHLGACGKAFPSHRRRSWWSGWLTLTGPCCFILLFYLVGFSGTGSFQVKYDGQLRVDEDEDSLACDFHCMRVEKNNTGKVEPEYSTVEKSSSMEPEYREHSPRSLASGRVENQRCCFWVRLRGTLSSLLWF